MPEYATLPIGTVIQRRYLVEGLLGRSNAGATYLVREKPATDARGKLFVLKEVVELNWLARHRLVSVGKLLRRLHHPGLSAVHQVLNDNKHQRAYWLVEYIAGQDLETLRQRQPEHLFALAQVMSIMAPIIAAVTYLHNQRPPILHGDIKPANILVRRGDGGVVLVDFGMMKVDTLGSTTDADCCRYRAPELYSGIIDVLTDIYALGATCYTLVTGKLPPDAHARLTQLGNKAMDPLEPVNSVVPALPMHVGKAIERAMFLDAQRRFSSAEEFWEALWQVPADHPAPVFGSPSVPQGPPTVSDPGLEQRVGQTIEKPVPELSPVVPASVEEQEDQDTENLPVVHVAPSIEEQEDLEDEKPPSVGPIAVQESIEEQVALDPDKPSPVVPSPQRVEEQEAKTIHLTSLPQIHLERWRSHQSQKNKNLYGQSRGSGPSLQNGEAPTQPSSSLQKETASQKPTEKSISPPEASSPHEPPELRVTDASTVAPFAHHPRSDQNRRIDQGSLWPDMNIEMSLSQSDPPVNGDGYPGELR